VREGGGYQGMFSSPKMKILPPKEQCFPKGNDSKEEKKLIKILSM